MVTVEPVIGEPAAVVTQPTERLLLVADVHAGIEVGLRYERGVELDSQAAQRRDRILRLISDTGADRLVVLGDLAHRIAAPRGEERTELTSLIDAVTDRIPLTLVVGNHDAGVAEAFVDDIDVVDSGGGVLGTDDGVGVVHGHTWPDQELLDAEVVCMGHEHPQVRLEDEVGGSRVERVWLRGQLDTDLLRSRGEPTSEAAADGLPGTDAAVPAGDAPVAGGVVPADGSIAAAQPLPRLIVFPAFNERSGGTWVNVPGQEFLSPFLPDGLVDGEAYLLDGTRLGSYADV